MDNEKLTNLKPGQHDSDALTKKQIYDHVKVNGGSSSQPVDLTNFLKKDGSDKMTGLLNMDNRRIVNVGNRRYNTNDALTHSQFEFFYFDLNVDDGKIEAQNPIDMGNKKITRLQDAIHHKDAATKFYIDNSMTLKADKAELNNYILTSGLTSNLDMKNHNINNVKQALSGHQAINFSQQSNELSNYLHLSGATLTVDLQCNDNSIYGIKNVSNDTSAVNCKYVKDKLNKN